MAFVNEQFLKLSNNYLFSDIAKKVKAFKAIHPEKKVISLGIGDVTRPLPEAVCEAMHKAVDDMTSVETFHGYGPEQGYRFLIDAIVKHDYVDRGIAISPSEVFVSDGAKSDTGNFGDILHTRNIVGLTDPVYPVYLDSNIMNGRAGVFADGKWSNVIFLPASPENHFNPALPETRVDMVYLCFPNNPTGMALSKDELKKWVTYALENDVLILYDSAYEAFIQHPDIPHSIYEIEGAEKVAIEFRSFSKTSGFTGVRCGYTVIPEAVQALTADGKKVPLNHLWNRRQCTKFNGTSYITQRGAEAVYSAEGQKQIKDIIAYYMTNAHLMKQSLQSCGLTVYGGEDAPYLWIQTPDKESSWKFFDRLLYETGVVCTPGVGFGPGGEGFVRLTAFGDRADTQEALERITKWI